MLDEKSLHVFNIHPSAISSSEGNILYGFESQQIPVKFGIVLCEFTHFRKVKNLIQKRQPPFYERI